MYYKYYSITVWTWNGEEYEPVSAVYETCEEAENAFTGIIVNKDIPRVTLWGETVDDSILLKEKNAVV